MLSSLLVSVLALAFTVVAHPQLRAAPLAQVITACTKPNTVALTFDDGPFVYAYDISKALLAAGGKGTWFLNGDNWDCIYTDDNIKRMKHLKDKGHQLASHTWTHHNLSTLTRDQLHDEFWRVEQALQRIVGVQPAHMRPPFGAYNDVVRGVASERGQKIVNWDFYTGDADEAPVSEQKRVFDEAIGKKPSSILTLMHETYLGTAHEFLPYAMQKLKAAGYQMVTVAECLGEEPYQWTTTPGTKDDF